MKKFFLLTFLLIVARLSDIITTYIYIPNLEKELNPIVSIFGQGWTTMLIVQVILISGFIYSLWVYCTKKPTLPKVDNLLTLKEFISLFNFNDTKSFKKIFYKIPKNKTAIFYTIGYCGTISLIILSFFVAISTTFLIFSPDYRIFYRHYKIPVFLILSFVVIFIFLLTKFYKKEYSKWLLDNKTAGNIGFAARLARHESNGYFIAVVLHLGWTNTIGLLFVILYFYFFTGLQFRAGHYKIPAQQQALPFSGKFIKHPT